MSEHAVYFRGNWHGAEAEIAAAVQQYCQLARKLTKRVYRPGPDDLPGSGWPLGAAGRNPSFFASASYLIQIQIPGTVKVEQALNRVPGRPYQRLQLPTPSCWLAAKPPSAPSTSGSTRRTDGSREERSVRQIVGVCTMTVSTSLRAD